MRIIINTEDGRGLGTVSVSFEGLFVTDDGGELMIFLKRLMDMEDLCNEDRIKGNSAELLLVRGKQEKVPKIKKEKSVPKKAKEEDADEEDDDAEEEEDAEEEPKPKGKRGRPRKNDKYSPYRDTPEKPTPEVVGDEDEE